MIYHNRFIMSKLNIIIIHIIILLINIGLYLTI